MRIEADKLISRSEALQLLFSRWRPTADIETVMLDDALDRVVARDIFSNVNLPVYRASMADGIAVRSADFTNGIPDTSGWQNGTHYNQADTGDDFDDAFDAIIKVEEIFFDVGGRLTISPNINVRAGNLVRATGTTVKEGEMLVKRTSCLKPAHLAVLAAGGVNMVPVLAKPKVAFIPTGNELVPPGTKPERGQNIESNGSMIKALLKQWGALPLCYPIVRDNGQDIQAVLDDALSVADIVLINGGSSKGQEDYTVKILAERGEILQHGILIMPGRPVALAMVNEKPVINLPGPTLGAFYAMDWCVYVMVNKFLHQPDPVRRKVKVVLPSGIMKPPGVEMLARFNLYWHDGQYKAVPMTGMDSLPVIMNCNALLTLPIGVHGYHQGDEVEIELLCGEELINAAAEGVI